MRTRKPRLPLRRPVAAQLRRPVPLATVAWRGSQAAQRRLAQKETMVDRSLGQIADALYTLQDRSNAAQDGAVSRDSRAFERSLCQISAALEELDLTILGLPGEVYEGRVAECLESVAQRPMDGVDTPRIAEVIRPAVLRGARLLQMGKVVVEVPKKS